jgi:hypothetical protein
MVKKSSSADFSKRDWKHTKNVAKDARMEIKQGIN